MSGGETTESSISIFNRRKDEKRERRRWSGWRTGLRHNGPFFGKLRNNRRWNEGKHRAGAENVLKVPVAGILLGNYEVIGKVPKRGTRLGVLHLITSNKRSSIIFFSIPLPPSHSFPLTVLSFRRAIHDPPFAVLNVLTRVTLRPSI